MRGNAHLAIGASAWITVNALAGPPRLLPLTLGTLMAAAGALMPDTDRGRVTGFLTGGHRGATHSALGATVAGIAALLAFGSLTPAWWLPLALITGWGSHIAADSMTKTGCPWLWPWRRKFWLLPEPVRISTGGRRKARGRRGIPFGETIISSLAVMVTAGICYWRW